MVHAKKLDFELVFNKGRFHVKINAMSVGQIIQQCGAKPFCSASALGS